MSRKILSTMAWQELLTVIKHQSCLLSQLVTPHLYPTFSVVHLGTKPAGKLKVKMLNVPEALTSPTKFCFVNGYFTLFSSAWVLGSTLLICGRRDITTFHRRKQSWGHPLSKAAHEKKEQVPYEFCSTLFSAV